MPFDFLHSVQVYMTVRRLVTFVFLFQDFTAGFEYFPLFPKPLLSPRALRRFVEPRERGWVAERDFCFAIVMVCSVCFLQ